MATREKVNSGRKKVSLEKKEQIEDSTQTFFRPLKEPRVFFPLIVVILVGILLVAKGFLIAAIVNGRPITRVELIRQLEKRNGKQVLSSLIVNTLIVQEGEKKGITVDKKEIDDVLKQIEDNLAKQGQSLDQGLAVQGSTRNEFAKQLKIQKIVEKIFAKEVKVADKEVNDYIEKNKSAIPKELKPEEAKVAVRRELQQQKLASLVEPWIENLQKKAKINYFVNY